MTFQVDLTQKKNGTFLADAHAKEGEDGLQNPLRANPYRDAAAFRTTLRHSDLDAEAENRLQQASAEAEGRPEVPVSCEVQGVETEQLRKIGLN